MQTWAGAAHGAEQSEVVDDWTTRPIMPHYGVGRGPLEGATCGRGLNFDFRLPFLPDSNLGGVKPGVAQSRDRFDIVPGCTPGPCPSSHCEYWTP